MLIYAIEVHRPDKKHPYIAFFSGKGPAHRTVVRLMNNVIADYGHDARLMVVSGYKRAIEGAKVVTGEQRIAGEVHTIDLTPAQCQSLTINSAPLQGLVWSKPTSEMLQIVKDAPRVNFAATGVERFMARRAEAERINYLYDQVQKLKRSTTS